MSWLADFIEEHAFSCFFKENLGIECLGCGFQRSLIHLFNGDFESSIRIYPALIPILALCAFALVHIFFRIRNGHKIILALFILSAVLMICHYIIKQLHFFSLN